MMLRLQRQLVSTRRVITMPPKPERGLLAAGGDDVLFRTADFAARVKVVAGLAMVVAGPDCQRTRYRGLRLRLWSLLSRRFFYRS